MVTIYHAVAPGTQLNRRRQAKAYITFSVIYQVNFLAPTITDLVMYIKYMANSYTSPASIKNYFSGAKYWVTVHAGDVSSFLALEVAEMLKAVVSQSDHVPSPALPLTPRLIKLICNFLDSNSDVIKAIKPCILLTFSCMLRSSNVLSPNLLAWAGAHTLLASDVIRDATGLTVIIRSTKTTSRRNPVLLKVVPSTSHDVCPVRTWSDYAMTVNPAPFGPAFVTNSGLPLTAAPMVAAMRAALKAAGLSAVHRISMHSLRRGAVQSAAGEGVPNEEIMRH